MEKVLDQSKLIELLKKLSLQRQEIEVYLHLLAQGAKSIPQMARESHIPRTRLGRIFDRLLKTGLVQTRHIETGQIFEASPLDHIKFLLKEKEIEINSLKKSLPELLRSLSFVAKEAINMTKVISYSGMEGFRKITQNSINTKGTFRIFEVNYLIESPDIEFSEYIREEFVKNDIQVLQLINEKVLRFETKVTKLLEPQYWQLRHIPPEDLLMKYEMVVYNNVFAMYHFENEEFFGVEIYNEKLAKVQKQIFDFMWESAKPMKYLLKYKEARIL